MAKKSLKKTTRKKVTNKKPTRKATRKRVVARKKVTKKVTRRKVSGKPQVKPKTVSRKKSVINPLFKVKQICDPESDLILFNPETETEVNLVDLTAQTKQLQINVTDDPLDVYRSPHLLDLSQLRFIEKVKPADKKTVTYADLPAGDILEKMYLLELMDLKHSQILKWLKSSLDKTDSSLKKSFSTVDLTPKLPAIKKTKIFSEKPTVWQDISYISLIIYLGSLIQKAFMPVYWTVLQWSEQLQDKLAPDRVVEFSVKPVSSAQPKPSPLFKQIKAAEAKQFKLDKLIPDIHLNLPDFQLPQIIIPKVTLDIKGVKYTPIIVVTCIALFFMLGVKAISYWQNIQAVRGQVLGQTEQAINQLKFAQNNLSDLDFQSAQSYIAQANDNFNSASHQLTEIKSIITVLAESIPIDNTYKSGKNILEAGEHLTLAGQYLITGINDLQTESNLSLTAKIKAFQSLVDKALIETKLAQANLDQINIKHLPEQNQAEFAVLQEKIPLLIDGSRQLKATLNFALDFLGDNDLRRYLIVFQNDNELRATGGFMGSYALVDIKSGEIANIELPQGGTYDVRAGLSQILLPPKPLQVINARWEFQDANWWPDWPTSAQKIAWFYTESGGPSVDGVIAINSDWLGELLAVTGPINVPEQGKTISQANFEQLLQESIELEAEDKTKPKKILSDLAPKLLDKIFSLDAARFMDLTQSITTGLSAKDILIYATDQDQQKFIVDNNWGGQIKNASKDYLSVVATNVGGGKTDNVIKQDIQHQANIQADGSVINQVIIKRYHYGPTDEHFTTHPNRSYLRIYVPAGSQLIKAVGFNQPQPTEYKALLEGYQYELDELLRSEYQARMDADSETLIYQENNKTVFANWLTILPGEAQEILLIYKLPFQIKLTKPEIPDNQNWLDKLSTAMSPAQAYGSYSLAVQKQPGSQPDNFVSQVIYPADWDNQINFPQTLETNPNQVTFSGRLDQDVFYLVGFKN